jgi:hypothetical protein
MKRYLSVIICLVCFASMAWAETPLAHVPAWLTSSRDITTDVINNLSKYLQAVQDNLNDDFRSDVEAVTAWRSEDNQPFEHTLWQFRLAPDLPLFMGRHRALVQGSHMIDVTVQEFNDKVIAGSEALQKTHTALKDYFEFLAYAQDTTRAKLDLLLEEATHAYYAMHHLIKDLHDYVKAQTPDVPKSRVATDTDTQRLMQIVSLVRDAVEELKRAFGVLVAEPRGQTQSLAEQNDTFLRTAEALIAEATALEISSDLQHIQTMLQDQVTPWVQKLHRQVKLAILHRTKQMADKLTVDVTMVKSAHGVIHEQLNTAVSLFNAAVKVRQQIIDQHRRTHPQPTQQATKLPKKIDA